jgi:competence ComEA-like helix-hairpin-helix protein
MFKKISIKTGFTDTEIKVLLFLLTAFLAGFTYIKLFKENGESRYREFDYTKEENLLLKSEQSDTLGGDLKKEENEASRNQILDLKTKGYESSVKREPAPNSINLNAASKGDLMKISGIGEKTAENIMNYRDRKGKFKELSELMNVKGIGEAKYARFKKYLFIK